VTMEADFRNMPVKDGLDSVTDQDPQLAADQAEAGQCRRIILSPEEIDNMNLKILSHLHDHELPFFIPAEQPIELLFFRRIFTRLREQRARAIEAEMSFANDRLTNSNARQRNSDSLSMAELADEADESIPIQAFQRSMGRLFYVLRDPEGFDSKLYDTNGNNIVGWGEFCYVWKDRQITVRLSLAERIYLTLDDPQSSLLARIVSVMVLFTIVMSSLGFILSTVQEFQEQSLDGSAPKPGPVFDYVEHCCLIIFVLEYGIRIGTCWAIREELFDKASLLELVIGYERIQLIHPGERLIRFVFGLQNLIDLAAILPGVAQGLTYLFTGKYNDGGGGFVVLRLVRLTRIFRVFRLGKYVEPVLVIGRTVKQSTKALYVLAFNLLLGVVIFGSLMYLMEQGEWDPEIRDYKRVERYTWNATIGSYEKVLGISPFKSIPHAFWWALVTSTTVGYGDHYPTTSNGYIVAVVCMVWSLVILALPVGVIGGTFLQVWEDFAKNKKKDREELRREMVYVAHAIQRIEPAKVSRLLLLEVWNDDNCQNASMPASPEDFMGEVKIELDIPPDKEIRGREMRLKLHPNLSVVKREISGYINVRYDWIPESSTSVAEAEDGEHQPLQKLLHGTLRLEILSARDLIKTDWGRQGGHSSPYVVALCYPSSPAPEASLNPIVWRSPTVQSSLNPVWQCEHIFRYLWYMPMDTVEHRFEACSKVSEIPCSRDSSGDRVTRFCESQREQSALVLERERSSGALSGVQPFYPESPGQDEVMTMLLQLTTCMPKLASSLSQIQEQVSNLTARVDHCSASLQSRSSSSKAAGSEGPGRPPHDLRAAGRSGPVSPRWEMVRAVHGAGFGLSSPVSLPSAEGIDAMEERRDIVSDATVSLPHAIPHVPNG